MTNQLKKHFDATMKDIKATNKNLTTPAPTPANDLISQNPEYAEDFFGKTYDVLLEDAIRNVCECYRHFVQTTDLTLLELFEVNVDSYYFHRENGETWKDCPEMAQERAEHLVENLIELDRGN